MNWTVYSLATLGLPDTSVFPRAFDQAGNLWLGTSYGAVRFDTINITATVYNASNSNLPGNAVYSVAVDSDGAIWIGTNQGVGVFYPDGVTPIPTNTHTNTPTNTPTVTSTPTAPSGSCVLPPPGLLSWWPGDGNTNDIIGSRNGTTVGGVAFTAGEVGQAFSFDGIDDIVLAPATGFPTGAASRTVAFWSRIGSLAGHSTGFAYGTEATGKGFYVFPSHYRTGGKLAFSGHGGEYDVLAPTDLRDDLYHHVAVTYDGAIITIYADGVSVVSGSLDLDTGISGGASIGGRGYMGELLTGEVDEVALWNRVLSASEIQAMFSAGSAGMCKNLTATHTPTMTPTNTPTPINTLRPTKTPKVINTPKPTKTPKVTNTPKP